MSPDNKMQLQRFIDKFNAIRFAVDAVPKIEVIFCSWWNQDLTFLRYQKHHCWLMSASFDRMGELST